MSTGSYVSLVALCISLVWFVKSRRRQYETALHALLQNGSVAYDILRMVLHTPAHYFILFTDKRRLKINAANAAFAAALGYSPEELEGMPYSDLLHQDTPAVVPVQQNAVFSSRYRKKDGGVLAVTWGVFTVSSGVMIYSLGENNE
jgi:PAS domain S-box-containing protein